MTALQLLGTLCTKTCSILQKSTAPDVIAVTVITHNRRRSQRGPRASPRRPLHHVDRLVRVCYGPVPPVIPLLGVSRRGTGPGRRRRRDDDARRRRRRRGIGPVGGVAGLDAAPHAFAVAGFARALQRLVLASPALLAGGSGAEDGAGGAARAADVVSASGSGAAVGGETSIARAPRVRLGFLVDVVIVVDPPAAAAQPPWPILVPAIISIPVAVPAPATAPPSIALVLVSPRPGEPPPLPGPRPPPLHNLLLDLSLPLLLAAVEDALGPKLVRHDSGHADAEQ